MTKPADTTWRIIIIGGKKAEYLGIVSAPNADAAVENGCEAFGITDEARRRRVVAQRIMRRATK